MRTGRESPATSYSQTKMKCPYCGQEALIDDVVKRNLERYGGSAKVRTRCCNTLIRVYPKTIFHCTTTDQKGKDDWGN